MRNGTKAFVSIVSLGVIAAGYQAGLAVEVSQGFSATAPVIDQNPTVTAAATATPDATAAPGVDSNSTPAPEVSGQAANPTSEPASQPKTSTAPAPVSTPKATEPAPVSNSTGTTKNGSSVQYRFGTVQVAVTKSAGKITGIEMLQAGATGGRQSAFTYLVDLAIQANGSNFGNLSGATYTVDAFKQSLEAALAKF